MEYQKFYEKLLERLKKNYPQRSTAIKELAVHLRMDQKNLARRMRGETPFTVEEIAKICTFLNISLDTLLFSLDTTVHPMKIYVRELSRPLIADSFRNLLMGLEYTALDRESGRVFFCSNFLPNVLYTAYPAITKFIYYMWAYRRYPGEVVSFENFRIHEEMDAAIIRYASQAREVKHSIYLLSKDIIKNISGYILSVHEIAPFPREYCSALIEQMEQLIDEIEQCALHGKWPGTDNNIYIYVTPLVLPNGILLTESSFYKTAIVYAFFLSPIITIHHETFDEIKTLAYALLRNAEIISVSGEKNRAIFIKNQREALSILAQSLGVGDQKE